MSEREHGGSPKTGSTTLCVQTLLSRGHKDHMNRASLGDCAKTPLCVSAIGSNKGPTHTPHADHTRHSPHSPHTPHTPHADHMILVIAVILVILTVAPVVSGEMR